MNPNADTIETQVVYDLMERQSLWHDDVRRPPGDDWIWVRTNEQAKHYLSIRRSDGSLMVQAISMDHDLGGHDLDPDAPDTWLHRGASVEGTGLDLVDWMVQNDAVPRIVNIHSWNGPGAERMRRTLEAARSRGMFHPATVIARKPYERPS